jgi:hypothetical protein
MDEQKNENNFEHIDICITDEQKNETNFEHVDICIMVLVILYSNY